MSETKFVPLGTNPITITPDALAALGAPTIVYVKPISVADAEAEMGDISGFAKDAELFSVHAADGTPMALVDGRDAAFAAARQYELEPVSVH